MNKNRNRVAAMMMVATITVSSVAMPVEATVRNDESVNIQREKESRVSEKSEEVRLDETYFPDPEFRDYLSWRFQINEGEIIPEQILNETKELMVGTTHAGNGFIEDLTGIEYFKNLTSLNCRRNNIKNIDLSNNDKLEELNCEGNFIKEIDFTGCTGLKKLYCGDNMIENLDVSNLKNLEELDCSENNISDINLKINTSLKVLNLSKNKITNIDLKPNTQLKELEICDTKLKNIDLSGNKLLETIDLSTNKYDYGKKGEITDINLSNNNELRILKLSNNKISSINLKNKDKLNRLDLSGNNISKIDLSDCINLKLLNLSSNKLRELDLTSVKSFYEEGEGVWIEGNEIGKLDVSEFKREQRFRQSIHLNVNSNKFIDLNKEFGITEDDINNKKIEIETENININGTKLEWKGNAPRNIEYTYKCGGRNNKVFLDVNLMIESDNSGETNPNPPEPQPNPNPPSENGGGTTNPDHNNNEKPNKPNGNHTEIIGANRYETAAKIADEMGSYNTVILVNSDKSMADGLSAASLSGKKNAPILLVKKDSIPSETMARIEKADNIYIIGGEGVISKKVESQLKGKKITRISGKDRYETSQKIANLLGDYKKAFIVNGVKGEADAMSVSAVAAKYSAPILLTNGKTSIHTKKANVDYYIIGGKAVVSNDLEDRYNADRISGVDRYSTNRKVIDEFYYDSKKVYFAKGDTLVDALTASALAKDNGIILVSEKANHSKLDGKDTVQVGGMNFEINFK